TSSAPAGFSRSGSSRTRARGLPGRATTTRCWRPPTGPRGKRGPGMPLLEIDGVGVQFGGVTAVDDASFTAEAGRITGLIGPNGAGKTTCFNVISGLQKPPRGTV